MLAALVLIVATVALVVRAPSPPSISEFAPQAVKQIKKAPQDQSSQFGKGGAGNCFGPGPCAHGPQPVATPTALPTPTGPIIDKARVRQCIGNPARQIEDYQSPPCVAYWQGDNGGATWKGVSKTTITVAYPGNIPEIPPQMQDIVAFFNSRFEFYGRKIVLAPFSMGGLYNQYSPTTMYSGAVTVDQQLHAFASLPFASYQSGAQDSYYYDELARRQIISVTGDDTMRTEKDNFDKPGLAGYEWTFQPALDTLEKNLGRYLCTSLVGKAPSYAGNPIFPGTRAVSGAAVRKFGIAQQYQFSAAVDDSALVSQLKACGATPEVKQFEPTESDPQIQSLMSQFGSDGVTSMICVCFGWNMGLLQKNANQVAYQPEWMELGGASFVDDDNGRSGGNANFQQVSHTIGIYAPNKINPITAQPYFWAAHEVDPKGEDAGSQTGINGIESFIQFYDAMLLLASGIQLAGPHLTPQSFEQGLMAAQFPNPHAGEAPYYQATVGFEPGDHSMVADVGLGYWDESVQSYETGRPGVFCLVGQGQRFTLNGWRPIPETKLHPQGGRPPTEPCP